jgi:hypothetical protein
MYFLTPIITYSTWTLSIDEIYFMSSVTFIFLKKSARDFWLLALYVDAQLQSTFVTTLRTSLASLLFLVLHVFLFSTVHSPVASGERVAVSKFFLNSDVYNCVYSIVIFEPIFWLDWLIKLQVGIRNLSTVFLFTE